ncbi:Hydroxyacylglutathione hydrolase [Thauera sp. GDN1]|nr:Hydroxyacylglutathione hydrolase [Thauera sp. GDN1]
MTPAAPLAPTCVVRPHPRHPRPGRFPVVMRWLARVLAALSALLALIPGAHAERFDYRLEPREIAPGAYVIVGLTEDFSFTNGGNIANAGFLVGTEGVIVIDTGSSKRYGEQMLAAIRRVTPLPVVLTLNTHHHPDHFLGNQAFPPATLAALPETIAAIRSEGEAFNANMYRLNGDWMLDTEVVVPARAVEPGRQRIGGRDVELLALGGHTVADLALVDHDTGTVFAADLVFNGRAPTTPHADIARWLAALDALERLPAQRWVPGHGEVVTDTAPLRQTRDYLAWLQRTIRQSAEDGLDMSEVFATPIPARFAALALVENEFRRSVAHLFPAAEQAVLEGPARADEAADETAGRQAGADAGIRVRHFADVGFSDVRDALAEAIAAEGITPPVVSHFGHMLDRTAPDLGHARGLYAEAEILTFCNAAVAARLAAEAREHIALCPLSIGVYAEPRAPREVRVAYRPPGIDTPGATAARELMARIVRRAAALLGRE